MNSRRHHIFPKYFQHQQEPSWVNRYIELLCVGKNWKTKKSCDYNGVQDNYLLVNSPVICTSAPSHLHLCRGVRPPTPNECPGYDTKQSNGEVPVMLELWGMQSSHSLPSLPAPLWPGEDHLIGPYLWVK